MAWRGSRANRHPDKVAVCRRCHWWGSNSIQPALGKIRPWTQAWVEAAAGIAMARDRLGWPDIPTRKRAAMPSRRKRLDHEQRVVAAGAGSGLQRIERMLGALLMALAVDEHLADAVGHIAQNIEGRGRPFRIEKIPGPCGKGSPFGSLYCGVMT